MSLRCICRGIVATLIALLPVGNLAAKAITVDELAEAIGTAVASHRSDKDTARRISEFQLSERITEDRLATLQSRAPGAQTARILEELMEQSAFLEPPGAEKANAAAPSMADQNRIFGRMVTYVVEYARRLPNFVCTQSILRFNDDPFRPTDGVPALGRLHALDNISTQLRYFNGEEAVQVSTVNGKPYKGTGLRGISTFGEFGNIIISLVAPISKTRAVWSHWEVLHGQRVAVFRYTVAAANSRNLISYSCAADKTEASITPAYNGFVFIDEESGAIVRITRTSVNIPATFPTQRANSAVEYGLITIGSESYRLPIRSVTESDNPAECPRTNDKLRLRSLNEIGFSNYRKYGAESRLLASDEPEKQNTPAAPPRSAPSAVLAVTSGPVPLTAAASLPSEPAPEIRSQPPDAPANQSAFSLPQAPPFREAGKSEAVSDDTFSTHATFRERVNIVTVPVVIRDPAGQAVAHLTKDDFELTDNGKRQTISNFAEQAASPKPATPINTASSSAAVSGAHTFPDRYVAYVFDDIHLAFGDLSQTRSAVERVLKELLDPGTRLAVLTTSGHVALNFTMDQDKIVDAIKRVRPTPMVTPHSDCPDVSYYMADRIINKDDGDALNIAVQEAIAKCGADPKFIEVARTLARSAAQRSLSAHEYETRATLDAIKAIALGMAAVPGERSMVLVSPGFLALPGLPEMQAVIDRAARSGLVIHALDARGLYAPAGSGAEESGSTSPAKLRYQQSALQVDSDPLAQLADATGGRIFQNSNDYDAGFRHLSERPSVVYLLGFSPMDTKADGRYHKLKVTVKARKGLQVQARHGYLAHKGTPDPVKEAKEEVQNALLSREEMRDIPIEVNAAPPAATDGNARLRLMIHVDPRSVQFQKQDGHNRDKLSITFGLFDSNGNVMSVMGQEVPLDFEDKDLQRRLESGFTVKSDLDLKPGCQFVRLVLRDLEGQMSTANEVVR